MPLLISDEHLQQAGLTEEDARLELACRLFDANRLTLHQAASWVGLERVEMESALLSRGISVYCYTEDDLRLDLATMKQFDEAGNAGCQ